MPAKSNSTAKFVAYYRVSTREQGDSRLGLEAQKQTVYSRFDQRQIIAEYTEVESGRNQKRIELQKALAHAKDHKCGLVIAKLDRLSRSVSFIFALKESGVNFVICDLPELNTLNLGIFASLAQYEAELISERTRAALAAKKAQGFSLGSPGNLTTKARALSVEARRRKAQEQDANRKAYLIIKDLVPKLSLRAIASKLNAYGVKTITGKAFTAQQVKNIRKLYEVATCQQPL